MLAWRLQNSKYAWKLTVRVSRFPKYFLFFWAVRTSLTTPRCSPRSRDAPPIGAIEAGAMNLIRQRVITYIYIFTCFSFFPGRGFGRSADGCLILLQRSEARCSMKDGRWGAWCLTFCRDRQVVSVEAMEAVYMCIEK